MNKDQLKSIAAELEPYVIECRRTIHRFAEPNGSEIKTGNFIKEEARKLGLKIKEVEGTGFIVILDTGRPGKNIALRADMDALPMEESEFNLKQRKVVVSENPKGCHACGHDAHCAMLMGAMKGLAEHRDELNGTIYFMFEQGEESDGGWREMIEGMKEFHVDACWGIHVFNQIESGNVSIEPGPRMSGAYGIHINVIGKGGHASRPDLSNNPVFCASSILVNTAVAWVNQIPVGHNVTYGPTRIVSGDNAVNIIPDCAEISGSCRTFEREIGLKAIDIMKNVAEHTAAMNGCRVEFGERMCERTIPVDNDPAMTEIALEAAHEVLPEDAFITGEKWFGGESFSRYQRLWPGVFMFLGIKNDELGSGAEHHSKEFVVDESALKTGVLCTMAYVNAFQK